jgi:4-carboxymuconolactone decarboxylase
MTSADADKEGRRPRITPLEPPYSAEIAAMLRRWMAPAPDREPLRIFRTLARHHELASRMGVLGAGLLGHARVAPRDREILIHRVTARCGAEYEWAVHAAVYAYDVGLTRDQLYATVHGPPDDPAWSERERLLIRLADEVHGDADISDALWASLSETWSEEELMELVVIASWYRVISTCVNAVRPDLEPWTIGFPASLDNEQATGSL